MGFIKKLYTQTTILMKKQVQSVGQRNWFGDDILMIQNEVWSVLEGLLSQYGNACIVSGCKVTPNVGTPANFDITPGIILIQDHTNNWQYARFTGATDVSLPQYAVCIETDTNELYGDSVSKPYVASFDIQLQPALPGSGGYLQFTGAGAATWLDIIQSSNCRFVNDAQIAAWNAAASIKPGFIMMQAMPVVPAGWFECDGSAISRAIYANLFAAIGTMYGIGDGATTFNIPDMRGYFPRGYDHGRGVDAGRSLGSDQASNVGTHTHPINSPEGVPGIIGTGTPNQGISGGGHDGGAYQVASTGNNTGDAETRPVNKALLFIIKY